MKILPLPTHLLPLLLLVRSTSGADANFPSRTERTNLEQKRDFSELDLSPEELAESCTMMLASLQLKSGSSFDMTQFVKLPENSRIVERLWYFIDAFSQVERKTLEASRQEARREARREAFRRKVSEALFQAVKWGRIYDLAEIMREYESEFDINSLNQDGKTLLYCATECGEIEAVQFLLSNNANPIIECNGETPLSCAALQGNAQIFDLLLQKCLELKADPEDMYLALEHAVDCGRTAIVKSLLAARVGFDEKMHMIPILRLAAFTGHFDIWWLLLSAIKPDLVDPNEECILYSATDLAEVSALLLRIGKSPEDVTAHLEYLLFGAAKIGHVQICELLLNANVNPAVRIEHGDTALHKAANNGHVRICELMLAAGTDPNVQNSYGSTPLYYTARNGRTEICKLLLDAGASLDDKKAGGQTPLLIAAIWGHIKTVRLLLDLGADPSIQGSGGNTPLKFLIRSWQNAKTSSSSAECYSVILALLRDQRAASSANTELIWSPLHYAAYTGAADNVDELLATGSPLNATDLLGLTPLHCAVIGGHINIVEKLVQYGADIQVLDSFGHSLVYHAVLNDDADMIRALLALDASFRELGPNGETLLHVAIANGHCNAIRALAPIIDCNALDIHRHITSHSGQTDAPINTF